MVTSDGQRMSELSDRCGYCKTQLHGKYCHHCGVYNPQQRLNLRSIGADLYQRVLQFEASVFKTSWHLLKSPSKVLLAFFAGQRRHYTHPFSYMLLIGTLAVLLASIAGESFWLEFKQMMAAYPGKQLTGDTLQRYLDFYVTLYKLLPYWTFLSTLPMAALSWLIQRQRGYHLAELWIACLYAAAFATLLGMPLFVLCDVLEWSLTVKMSLENALLMLMQVWFLVCLIGWRQIIWLLLAAIASYAVLATFQNLLAHLYAVAPTFW